MVIIVDEKIYYSIFHDTLTSYSSQAACLFSVRFPSFDTNSLLQFFSSKKDVCKHYYEQQKEIPGDVLFSWYQKNLFLRHMPDFWEMNFMKEIVACAKYP